MFLSPFHNQYTLIIQRILWTINLLFFVVVHPLFQYINSLFSCVICTSIRKKSFVQLSLFLSHKAKMVPNRFKIFFFFFFFSCIYSLIFSKNIFVFIEFSQLISMLVWLIYFFHVLKCLTKKPFPADTLLIFSSTQAMSNYPFC